MLSNEIYLELTDEKHHKFYELELKENTLRTNYGRIGCQGKSKILLFHSPEDSLKFFEKQFKGKKRKGYSEAIKGLTLPKLKGFHPGQLRINFI